MKNIINILMLTCVIWFVSGCTDDNYPGLIAPVPDENFPKEGVLYIPENADGLMTPSVQIPISSENAETYYVDGVYPGQKTVACYKGQSVDRVLDGNAKTQNANNQWQISTLNSPGESPGADPTATAVDLVISIPEGTDFDYFKFVNRTWNNGFPHRFEWFVSLTTSPDTFESQGYVQQVANLASPSAPPNTPPYGAYASILELPENLIGRVAKIKFRISFDECRQLTAGQKVMVCREIELWKKGKIEAIPDCFTDRSCSALKPGTTTEDVEAIASPFFKNLAKAIIGGYYETNRIIEVLPSGNPDEIMLENKTSLAYSKLHYPTGISVSQGDQIVVLGEGINSKTTLTIIGKDKPYASAKQEVELENGINSISCAMSGTVYLSNMDNEQTGVKVNIANGYMNNYFDITKHENSSFPFILSVARPMDNIDLTGKKSMLTVSVSDLEKFCTDPVGLMEFYDEMIFFQQEFSGMTHNSTKFHYLENAAQNSFAMESYWCEFNNSMVRSMLNADLIENVLFMNTAKANIPKGFNWAAIEKTQANMTLFGAVTADYLTRRSYFDENIIEYDMAFKYYFIDKKTHAGSSNYKDWNVNAVPLWQLFLYFTKVRGIDNFYPEIFKIVRQGSNTAEAFAKAVCQISGYNLTSFFNKWGYGLPNGFEGQLSSDIVNNIPNQAIEYISMGELRLYKTQFDVSVVSSAYYINPDGKLEFDLSGCKNSVAFEVMADGVPIYVSVQNKFAIEKTSALITVQAIAANGTKTPVPLIYN